MKCFHFPDSLQRPPLFPPSAKWAVAVFIPNIVILWIWIRLEDVQKEPPGKGSVLKPQTFDPYVEPIKHREIQSTGLADNPAQLPQAI